MKPVCKALREFYDFLAYDKPEDAALKFQLVGIIIAFLGILKLLGWVS